MPADGFADNVSPHPGALDRDALTQRARTLLGRRQTHPGREPGYVFHHGVRTAKLAVRLAEQHGGPLDVEGDVLYAAGLFHDIGKGVEPHHETGAVLVRHVLRGEVDTERLEAIARLVREHNQRRPPSPCPLSSQLLQDADLLDHIGAQNVWLMFGWSATHGRSVEETLTYFDDAYSEHASLRTLLNLDVSRAAFDRRLEVERRFMQRLRAEADGQL